MEDGGMDGRTNGQMDRWMDSVGMHRYRTYRTDGTSGKGAGLRSQGKVAGRKEGQTDRARFTSMSGALRSQSSPGRRLVPLLLVPVAQRWPRAVPDHTGRH